MPEDQKLYEIEIKVRDGGGAESVRHLEGPLPHNTTEDVAIDLVGTLSTRSSGKVKTIPGTDR